MVDRILQYRIYMRQTKRRFENAVYFDPDKAIKRLHNMPGIWKDLPTETGEERATQNELTGEIFIVRQV